MRLSVRHRRTQLPRRRLAPPSPPSTPPACDTPPRTPAPAPAQRATRRTRQSTRKQAEDEDATCKETSSSKLSDSRPDTTTTDVSDVGYANVTTRKRRRESPDGLAADDALFRGFDPSLIDASGLGDPGSDRNVEVPVETKTVRSAAGDAKRPRRVGVASLAAAFNDRDSVDSSRAGGGELRVRAEVHSAPAPARGANSGGGGSAPRSRSFDSVSTGIHSYDSDNP